MLQVDVFRVDDVQGKEYRALLLSTVRTCYSRDDGDLEEDAGFLTNPKVGQLSVAGGGCSTGFLKPTAALQHCCDSG